MQITFRVNLETQDRQGFLQPNRTTVDGNETVSEADNVKSTRTIWLPNRLRNNYAGIAPNNLLKHGDEFTVSDYDAIYLKNLYVTGSPDDVLQIVSQS